MAKLSVRIADVTFEGEGDPEAIKATLGQLFGAVLGVVPTVHASPEDVAPLRINAAPTDGEPAKVKRTYKKRAARETGRRGDGETGRRGDGETETVAKGLKGQLIAYLKSHGGQRAGQITLGLDGATLDEVEAVLGGGGFEKYGPGYWRVSR